MLYVHRFPTHPLLGRNMVLDERSLEHTIERQETRPKIAPISHPLGIDVLDQSNLLEQDLHVSQLVHGADDVDELGSCTGNAGVYSLSTSPKLTERVKAAGGILDERYAIQLYAAATVADEYPGEAWPPTDCGSSGLGVCKVLRARELIGRYQWATTADGLAALLQRGSILVGMPWYNAFFEPDNAGFIDAAGPESWTLSGVAGGHEICVISLATWNERDPGRSVLEFPNSWGESWGDNGYGRMRLATYSQLRSQIDIKQIRV